MARTGVVVAAVVGVFVLVLFLALAAVTGFGRRMGPAELGLFGLFALFGILGFVLAFAAAIHALVRDDLGGIQRLIWIALAMFIPFGGLVYFLLGRARTRELFRDIGPGASG